MIICPKCGNREIYELHKDGKEELICKCGWREEINLNTRVELELNRLRLEQELIDK